MELVLRNCTVRSFVPQDAESHTEHINSRNIARNMCRIPYPFVLQDSRDWIAIATSHEPETNFAITIDGKSVGGIGLSLSSTEGCGVTGHAAEIGYWLGEKFWGRGIMTEVLEAVTDWGFSTFGLVRIHASVFAHNPASARVLEKAGYLFEGIQRAAFLKDSEFIDGLLYAKVKLPKTIPRQSCQKSSNH
ncbi:MAG TPA: GNAT family protein [Chthoniobacterales bacterium]